MGGGGREGPGVSSRLPPSLLLLLLPAACPCPGYNGKAAELRPFELWDRSLFEFPIAERTSPTPHPLTPSTQGPARGFGAAGRPRPAPFVSPSPLAAGGLGCAPGYEDSCSLESSGSSGTRDPELGDPPTPQAAPAELGAPGGMLLDLAVRRPAVRSKIKVTAPRTLPPRALPRLAAPGSGSARVGPAPRHGASRRAPLRVRARGAAWADPAAPLASRLIETHTAPGLRRAVGTSERTRGPGRRKRLSPR